MKWMYTFCSLFLFTTLTHAQEIFSSRFFIKADTMQVERFDLDSIQMPDYEVMLLPLGFGEVEVKDKSKLEILKNARIKQVQLVYTSYPEELNLYELNAKRFKYLHVECEGVFGNAITNWKIIKQTGCHSREEANHYFHGFVVHYKPGASSVSSMSEWKDMLDILDKKKPLEDSSIYTVLTRNDFSKSAVVIDFTGSMTPYATQVFVWMNMNLEVDKNREFIFFNDGDNAEDFKKVLGKTGGIYYVQSWNRDTILRHAALCREHGYGGDGPENDIEALLAAVNANPKLKELVLIADNWAPIRDMVLVSKLKVPVHVIVCGKEKDTPLNPDLLNLFYNTKGSIHTMEEDLKYLEGLTEGKKFKLDGQDYIIHYGKVEKVKVELH